jgi:hypothetical protein
MWIDTTIMASFNTTDWSGISAETLRNNMLGLNVYYNSLTYTSVTEAAKFSSYDIMSIIGGYGILFLGFSFLSLIEIIDLVVKVAHVTVTFCCVKQKKNN